MHPNAKRVCALVFVVLCLISITARAGRSLPESYHTHLDQGMESWEAGDPSAAAPEFRAAALIAEVHLVNDPADPELAYRKLATALNMLGVCQQSDGDLQACLATVDRILKLTSHMDLSEEAEWRMNRGTCLSSLNRAEEALREYDLVLALLEEQGNPFPVTLARLHMLHGSTLFNAEMPLASRESSYLALKAYRDSKFFGWGPQDAHNVGVIHYNLGLAMEQLDGEAKAYEHFEIGTAIMTFVHWPGDDTLRFCREKFLHYLDQRGEAELHRQVMDGTWLESDGETLGKWGELGLSYGERARVAGGG